MEQAEQTYQSAGEQELEAVLHSLAKALKAISFYPASHPQREESIVTAYRQILPLLGPEGLTLLWHKDGCASETSAAMASKSATAKMLAREMLKRKLKRLVLLPQLSLPDLKAFLSLINTDEATIYAAGGIDAEMLRLKIGTIGANEVDLTVLRGLQQSDESEEESGSGGEPGGADEPETVAEDPAGLDETDLLDIQYSILGMDILLGMLKAEYKDAHFLQLAQEAIDGAEELKRRDACSELLTVLEALLEVYEDPERPATQKEFIRYALEQIAGGTMTTYLLNLIEERPPESEQVLDRLCAAIGKNFAYPLIQRLCVAEVLRARKTLAIALTRTGEAALPALIPMLKDERWYVVRNMVTILGEIGSAEALHPLLEAARHQEPKVRKETIKSFLKINSPEGEQKIIAMIDDADEEVARQAISSLGFCRSRAAVRTLLQIATTSDPLMKHLELKKQAVAALGKIGDRQATGPLLDLLASRGWLAPGRWQELKIVVANALGQLGDENAIPALKKLARRNNPFGIACGEAADNLERLVK